MKKSSSFKKYVSLSFVVHVLVLGGLFLFGKIERSNHNNQSVSVELLSPDQLLPKINPAKSVKLIKPQNLLNNQIVEQNENSINEKEPVDARFLSAKNQIVTKQTVATQKGQFQNSKKVSQNQEMGDGKAKALSISQAYEQPKQKSLSHEEISKNLFAGFDPNDLSERKRKQEPISEKSAEDNGKGLGQSAASKGEKTDSSQTNDYVKDVENGLETMLNTREFKYYSYYNRIRRQLTQHWESKVRQKLSKMFREGRAPAATGQDRITKLMIFLDPQGTLVRVQVLSDSGVRDLDDAAIDAFRAAAPFPNPPKGIIETDGTVKIRWDFVLES